MKIAIKNSERLVSRHPNYGKTVPVTETSRLLEWFLGERAAQYGSLPSHNEVVPHNTGAYPATKKMYRCKKELFPFVWLYCCPENVLIILVTGIKFKWSFEA